MSRQEVEAEIERYQREIARLRSTLVSSTDSAPDSSPGPNAELPSELQTPNEARLRDFVDIAADWFWETDAEDRVSYLSDRFELVFSIARAPLIGRPQADAYQAIGAQYAWQSEYGAAVAERAVIEAYEFSITLADGSVRWFEISGRPWSSAAGTFSGYRGTGREVTAARSAEQAKRHTNRYLRAVADHTESMVYLKDTSGRYLLTNRAFDALYDLEPGAAIGRTTQELLGENSTQRTEHDDVVLTSGEPSSREYPVNVGPMTWDILEMRFPVHDDDGQLLGLGGIMTNVSAIAAAERDLRQSEERFRAIAESTPHPVFIERPESGKIVYANDSFSRAFALLDSPHDHVASKFFRNEEDYASVRHKLLEKPGRRIGQVLRFQRENGDEFWGVMSAVSLTFEHERATLYSVVDITDRMEAETALEEQTTLFRTIFNHVPEGVVFTDTRGDIQMLNRGAEEVFEITAADALGQPIHTLFECDDALRLSVLDQAELPAQHNGVTLRRQNGDTFTADIRTTGVRDATAQTLGALSIFRDVSAQRAAEFERELLEQQLRQSQKMQAIGELTGGIAHDFNNILASVLGYTQLALQFCVTDNESNLARYLREVRTAGERARDLVSQMLTFSRTEGGDLEPAEVLPLIHEAVRMLRATIPATITIDIDEGTAPLPRIALDPVQLQQVLMNLCINARDAIAGPGRIWVSVRATEAQGQCTSCNHRFGGEMVILEVKDSGPGVAPDVRARMFEPFFTTKKVGDGAGMGLAMVHGIVHRHHGHLSATSENGFSMRLYFPVHGESSQADVPVAAKEVYSTAPDGPCSGNIVVVDDESAIMNFLAELLNRSGYDVRGYTDSGTALQAITDDPHWPDVLITDQTMPGTDGKQLVNLVRRFAPDLPVILCTGHSDVVNEHEVSTWGNSVFLPKPVERDRLLKSVHTLYPQSATPSL